MQDRERKVTEEKDGLLYVPGLKEPLERDPIRSLDVSVSDLKVSRSFDNTDGKTTPTIRVGGKAVLENCTLGLAGEQERTREVRFSAGPIHPNEIEHQWRASIGFLEADWELGSGDEWFIQGYIPEIIFDEFVAAFKAGEANGLSVRIRANLWADGWVRYAPIAEEIHWKLSQGKHGAGMAQGTIEHFSWEVVPRNRLPIKKEDTAAYKAGQEFAQGLSEDLKAAPLPPVPTDAQQKTRWGWWVLGGIVLLSFLLLRNG